MLIPFKSKAAADFFMLENHAQALIVAMGLSYAPQGVIVATDIASRLTMLRQFLVDTAGTNASDDTSGSSDLPLQDLACVGLKQRAWPLIDMMEKSLRKNTTITWGSNI